MTIKTQLRIFAAVIIMIPLLCLLSIRGYRHYSAVQRTFLKDFRRIESNTTINISSEDWDVLLNAVRNMEPDIEAALIIQDVVQVSTMEELKENQIIREKELWNFVRDTGFKYAYRFEIPPADIPSQKGVMLLSRVARQKDGDIQHAVPLVILTFSLIFIMMCMLTIFTISHSIFSSLMLLKKQTQKIADGDLDLNTVIEKYQEIRRHDQNLSGNTPARSAEEFSYTGPEEEKSEKNDDVLVIDSNLKGIDYQLAKCCRPIYGDEVFGFVTVNGGIKIHRTDCPNAPEMRKRFGYRMVKAKWSGKGSNQYSIGLKVVGNDDIGIVNNITSIISKENNITMRAINIDSHDGLFSGYIEVMLEDTSKLDMLLKRLRTVRGVKQVIRQ